MRSFKRAVTDSDTCVRYDAEGETRRVEPYDHLFRGHRKSFSEIEAEFAGKGYGDFKMKVGEAVVEMLRPIREESESS